MPEFDMPLYRKALARYLREVADRLEQDKDGSDIIDFVLFMHVYEFPGDPEDHVCTNEAVGFVNGGTTHLYEQLSEEVDRLATHYETNGLEEVVGTYYSERLESCIRSGVEKGELPPEILQYIHPIEAAGMEDN